MPGSSRSGCGGFVARAIKQGEWGRRSARRIRLPTAGTGLEAGSKTGRTCRNFYRNKELSRCFSADSAGIANGAGNAGGLWSLPPVFFLFVFIPMCRQRCLLRCKRHRRHNGTMDQVKRSSRSQAGAGAPPANCAVPPVIATGYPRDSASHFRCMMSQCDFYLRC